MKKILLLTLALICLIGCGSGGNKDRENSCIYNGMYWGDEKEDIIAEKGEPVKYLPDNSIQYDEQFKYEDCRTFYYFDDDWKLNKIQVSVIDSILKYDDIRNVVVEMYGEPITEETDENGYRYVGWVKGNTNIELCVIEELKAYSVVYSLKTE